MDYVSVEEYEAISLKHAVKDGEVESALTRAEADIDRLTYGRIRKYGFDALTEYQQSLVRQAVIHQADFVAEYGAMLDNPLASYGINGVSMSWDNSKIKCVGGVYTSGSIYGLLVQSGLAFRGVG